MMSFFFFFLFSGVWHILPSQCNVSGWSDCNFNVRFSFHVLSILAQYLDLPGWLCNTTPFTVQNWEGRHHEFGFGGQGFQMRPGLSTDTSDEAKRSAEMTGVKTIIKLFLPAHEAHCFKHMQSFEETCRQTQTSLFHPWIVMRAYTRQEL